MKTIISLFVFLRYGKSSKNYVFHNVDVMGHVMENLDHSAVITKQFCKKFIDLRYQKRRLLVYLLINTQENVIFDTKLIGYFTRTGKYVSILN